MRPHPVPTRGLTGMRLWMASALAAVGFLALAGPASAAGTDPGAAPGAGPDAGYYRSSVLSVEPSVDGVKVSVEQGGQTVRLSTSTASTVVVLGYSGEPFLRFTPDGVQRNESSLTARLSAGLAPLPEKKAKNAKWAQVSDRPSFAWADYRVQWTAQERPPIVVRDPHGEHRVVDWALPLTVDDAPVLVRGAVDWTGTPRFGTLTLVGFGAAGLALAAAGAYLVLRSRRRRSARSRRGQAPAGRFRTPEVAGVGAGRAAGSQHLYGSSDPVADGPYPFPVPGPVQPSARREQRPATADDGPWSVAGDYPGQWVDDAGSYPDPRRNRPPRPRR